MAWRWRRRGEGCSGDGRAYISTIARDGWRGALAVPAAAAAIRTPVPSVPHPHLMASRLNPTPSCSAPSILVHSSGQASLLSLTPKSERVDQAEQAGEWREEDGEQSRAVLLSPPPFHVSFHAWPCRSSGASLPSTRYSKALKPAGILESWSQRVLIEGRERVGDGGAIRIK